VRYFFRGVLRIASEGKQSYLEQKLQVMFKTEMPVDRGFLLNVYREHNGERSMAVYGYARVSTDGQTLEAQQTALRAAGAERVFAEKESGIKTARAQLTKAVATLEAGDVLLVTKLDRLARSTRDLLNTLAAISDKGAGFKSLGDPWADTTTPHGKLMITVLGGIAEFERHLIMSRTNEGRARAKANGVKFGRKQKLTKHQRAEALARKLNGETLVDIARSYNVSHMTISRIGNANA
jgi:DNA invertase Pin-like site-specific DNA recombinase